MKKLLVVLLALMVIGVFAFADDAMAAPAAPVVTIGDWGRQVFAIGNTDNNSGSGYQAGLGTSWGANPRIVGLQISAHNDNAGFAISPSADNGTFGLTDENKAWISPLPGLTVESGITLETDTWRGVTDFGSDDWIRYPGIAVSGNTTTFARLGEGGFMTDVNYNKDGIGAWFGIQNQTVGGNSSATNDLPDSIQGGAAYTITGIGMIKAQYLGNLVSGANFLGASPGADIINAAFNLSAVKGLYEEVAIVYPLQDRGYTIGIADDISYAFAPLTLHGRVEAVSFDSNAPTLIASDLGLVVSVGADYDVGNGVTAGASFDYSNATQETAAWGYGLPAVITATTVIPPSPAPSPVF